MVDQKGDADGGAEGSHADDPPDERGRPRPREPTACHGSDEDRQDEHRGEPEDRALVRRGRDGGDTQCQPRDERHGELPVAVGGDEKGAARDGQERTTTLRGEDTGEVQTDDDADEGRSPCTSEREEKTDAARQPGRVGVRQRGGQAPESLRGYRRREPAPDQSRESDQCSDRAEARHGQCRHFTSACRERTNGGERSGEGDDARAQRQEVGPRAGRDRSDVPPHGEQAEAGDHERAATVRWRRNECGNKEHAGNQCDSRASACQKPPSRQPATAARTRTRAGTTRRSNRSGRSCGGCRLNGS